MRNNKIAAAVLTGLLLSTALTIHGALADPALTYDVIANSSPAALLPNAAFLPSPNAKPALQSFEGELVVSAAAIATADDVKAAMGKDPRRTPALDLKFSTVDGLLIPASVAIQGHYTLGDGGSYWQALIQAGRVWSEPGDPPGWSRASFPIALMNPVEGAESHNGVALFMFKDGAVTPLHIQISTGTTPFVVGAVFRGSAVASMSFKGISSTDSTVIKAAFSERERDRLPVRPWSDFPRTLTPEQTLALDGRMNPAWVLADAVSLDGTIYLKECQTPQGPLPYCDRQRFGVWSVTKATVNRLAMLRLAKKYGDDIYDLKVSALLPEAGKYPAWADVTLGSALNMATGVGNGKGESKPDIGDEPYDDSYMTWYFDGDYDGKIDKALARPRSYGWGVNKFARYRDEDFFILGVALDRLLKRHEGPEATLMTMLDKEVYAKIGVHDLPIAKTFGAMAQPLMFEGSYATIDDLIKIARLYQAGGSVAGEQILSAARTEEGLRNGVKWGLPTGRPQQSGERYFSALWIDDYRVGDCSGNKAQFDGYGGQLVEMFPNGVTVVRISSAPTEDESVSNMTGLPEAVNAVAELCR